MIDKIEHIVDRVGIPDTIGTASHRDVARLVDFIRNHSKIDLECHFHNDTDSAVANAFEAILKGVKYIDTTILGIGERNGITNLSGLIARLYSYDRSMVSKYNLKLLPEIDNYVAHCIGKEIPFNQPITGEVAFNHKAGIHINAILKNARSYQALDPSDFGRDSQINYINPLMGWNSLKWYLNTQLNLHPPKEQLQDLVRRLKNNELTLDELIEIVKS